jgi:hypothetical protein
VTFYFSFTDDVNFRHRVDQHPDQWKHLVCDDSQRCLEEILRIEVGNYSCLNDSIFINNICVISNALFLLLKLKTVIASCKKI